MKLYTTKSLLKRYSSDRSIYSITPTCIAFPKTEEDIVKLVHFANKHKIPITPRGGGTGLSGAGIGKGIILDCSKYLTKIKHVGSITRTEAGTLLKHLRPAVEKAGYMLPSVPLHGDCAIGGNVNTRSVGPRTIKYGTMQKQLKSIRAVLADGRIIDTRKPLPSDLRREIASLRNKIRKDKQMRNFLRNRPLSAGGYYLRAFIEYTSPKEIVTHLIAGSVGTLLILTEVELKLPKHKPLESLYLIHGKTFEDLQVCLNEVLKQGAVSLEYAGKDSLALWDKKYQKAGAVGVLIVGFEEETALSNGVKDYAASCKEIPQKQRRRLWKSRQLALPKLEKEAKARGFDLPPGIDDTTFHPKDFSKVMKAVKAYSKRKNIKIASFGHIGVASIHLRPFINLQKDKKKFDQLGKDMFKIVKKYKGTLVGEHNAGLCRSRYLEMESKKMYAYMKRVKNIFDPHNILNPRVMFNLEPITKHIKK